MVSVQHLNLALKKERLAVCQLAPDAAIPAWVSGIDAFCSLTRTSEELSIVCAENLVPKGVKQEAGWRVFQVEGSLDFALTGVLASIATPLAEAGISLFAVSTYNTDYVLVKDAKIAEAVKVLQAAGHTVKTD